MSFTNLRDTYDTLSELNNIILEAKESTPVSKVQVFGWTGNLDNGLGAKQISYPSTGYTNFVSNSGNSKATSDIRNFFNVVSNNLGKANIYVNGDLVELDTESNEKNAILFLENLYSNPDDKNPAGLEYFTRSENLDQNNEYNDNTVTYNIKMSPQLREVMKDKFSNFGDILPNEQITITIDKSVDQRLLFTRGLAKFDPYTSFLQSGGGRLDIPVKYPGTNNNVSMSLYQDKNKNIIGEMKVNGQAIPGSINNFTEMGVFLPEVIDNFIMTQTQNLMQTVNKQPVVSKSSGQINEGEYLSISDLKELGFYSN
jgi:hypothetical protein